MLVQAVAGGGDDLRIGIGASADHLDEKTGVGDPDRLQPGCCQPALHLSTGVEARAMRLPPENGIGLLTAGEILDIRRPRPATRLSFWSGQVYDIRARRLAILGTDCAVGKRTTTALLLEACRTRGLGTGLVYTGQSGWLQGFPHGFIFDATPNDFVCGELERAILECHAATSPDVILLEGQSGLRNPSGPCGSELVLAGGSDAVILQHAPGREFYEDFEELGCRIPPVSEEIEMIRLMGAEVMAVALNHENLDEAQLRSEQEKLQTELKLPVIHPLGDGLSALIGPIRQRLSART